MRIRRRSLLALLATAPLAGLAPGARAERAPRRTRKLVLVELQGGNDGLNTVLPAERELYAKLRPTLAVEDPLVVAPGLALHPALKPLAQVWERGELAVVQGVGTPVPVRSHFRSADIWHAGSDEAVDGWVARVLDGGPRGQPARGLVVGGDAGPLEGARFTALAADGDKTSRRVERPVTNAALAHLARVHDEVRAGRAEVDAVLGDGASTRAAQGKAFVEQARLAARALAGLDVAVIKLTLRGFDTHANQRGPHARLLEELARGLVELRARAVADGTWGSTLVATTSEFGRRARENASGGTDHGAAAPLFVLGGSVQGGLLGRAPRLDDLDEEGDVKVTTDYRAVLGGLARAAWGVDATQALGGVQPLAL